ncbi:secreted RxLR effector protein 161-like [Cryptomeria japonica]|uniref:secreted RxLR effector protein 161-like n=1 Tax=Cryptomeria japonica TaxID=3369 RepID=UPI0027D9F4F0|nr:secreted RxLR effector protein 161-like [Cryptomeria japonica]
MDVKTTFLNGDLKEDVYMVQPEGFVVKGQEQKKKYIGELLCRFGMQDCNSVSTPMEQNLKISSNDGEAFEDPTKYRQLVGSFIYLITTHLDITFAVGILSRFMHKPCEGHWTAAQRVLKYLKGTQILGIKYSKVSYFHLIGYSDSDFDGGKEHGVSTSGYLMTLGSTIVTWRSKKQTVPADSTTEAEYVAAAQATQEIVWLRKILEDL